MIIGLAETYSFEPSTRLLTPTRSFALYLTLLEKLLRGMSFKPCDIEHCCSSALPVMLLECCPNSDERTSFALLVKILAVREKPKICHVELTLFKLNSRVCGQQRLPWQRKVWDQLCTL